jgi:hypothetical protein
MSATTEKKGRPTVNKPSPTENWYSFRKIDNTPTFQKKVKQRRYIAKLAKVSRRRNR